jgi:hypothetical protein
MEKKLFKAGETILEYAIVGENNGKIFKVSEPIPLMMDRTNKPKCVKRFNHKISEWETISGDEKSGDTVFILKGCDNPKPKSNLFKEFCSSVLGIVWKPNY